MTFQKLKFEQVLHYLIEKCGALDNVGKTVLYKLLYFSDFDYYEEFEKKITGETYCKLPYGPAPSHFDTAVKSLKKKGKIKEIISNYGGNRQKKFISTSESSLSKLTADELAAIDRTIKKLSGFNATQISELSHRDAPYKAAEMNDNLDYEMVFYRDDLMSVNVD